MTAKKITFVKRSLNVKNNSKIIVVSYFGYQREYFKNSSRCFYFSIQQTLRKIDLRAWLKRAPKFDSFVIFPKPIKTVEAKTKLCDWGEYFSFVFYIDVLKYYRLHNIVEWCVFKIWALIFCIVFHHEFYVTFFNPFLTLHWPY